VAGSEPPPNSAVQESVPAAASPALTSILSLRVGAVIVAALYFAREVLVPITVAVLLSFVLSPLVDLLRRMKLGRVPSVLIAAITAIAIIGLIGTIIGSQVAQLASHAPEYAGTIEKKVEMVHTYALDKLSGVLKRLGYEAKLSTQTSSTTLPNRNSSPRLGGEQSAANELPSSPLGLLKKYLSPILSPFATLGIIVVVTIFVLLQKEDLRDRMIRLFGSTDLHRTTVAMDDAAKRLSRYFLAQLGLNSAFGVVIGIGLLLIGVPNPVLWAIISGLLRFGAVYRLIHIRNPADRTRHGGRSELVDGNLDGGALRGRRALGQPRRRADPVRTQHRTLPVRSGDIGDFLELALGFDRARPLDAAHAMSGRAW
jgi:predicted PurR-regulated permease PerM